MPLFTDILEQGRTSFVRPGFLDSRDWFREKAREVARINEKSLVTNNRELQRSRPVPGYMYLFSYDAKHKDTLPYFDRFPLVFPFSVDSDGFLGMNMHYIPHLLRARLMDALYDLSSNQKFDEKTKLRMSYDMLNASSKYKYFKPCVKRYLFSQLQTRFLLVPSNEWDIALFLPLERFTVNKKQAYNDSQQKIRRA
ncbi:DNA end protector protein [uncultured Caudovirales phage]|uniref:DNA end protector protein n=1 Tax=uncultured Caudovirales phage TaxID=2100421 RepID=A0A6J7WT68_9CAUD|nr:DNA end protector protein [uncultured Caudovirales phage]